jgi:protein-tyrosine phosphatase
MGFVDLHCHLLWDLDDGCRTAEETLEAARALSAVGYTAIAATPHVQARYGGGDGRLVGERLAEARALLEREGVEVALHGGGENVLDEGFLARAGTGDSRALGPAARYALVEVPFQAEVPDLSALVEAALARGTTPILAHPERCRAFVRDGRAAEVVRLGGALQLNLGALTGRHGPLSQALAERFLGEGLYAIAATDLHAPVGADEWVSDALEALELLGGKTAVQRLCAENPCRVLAGEDLT